jgi:hypothetical protein
MKDWFEWIHYISKYKVAKDKEVLLASSSQDISAIWSTIGFPRELY